MAPPIVSADRRCALAPRRAQRPTRHLCLAGRAARGRNAAALPRHECPARLSRAGLVRCGADPWRRPTRPDASPPPPLPPALHPPPPRLTAGGMLKKPHRQVVAYSHSISTSAQVKDAPINEL